MLVRFLQAHGKAQIAAALSAKHGSAGGAGAGAGAGACAGAGAEHSPKTEDVVAAAVGSAATGLDGLDWLGVKLVKQELSYVEAQRGEAASGSTCQFV